ncbi:transcriptional regulator GlxA family with amidase domain [Kitasatospora sp. GP82]|nr:transcriptional regulator GlxA family with amidase domain [Kitasatospora sp. GP82]
MGPDGGQSPIGRTGRAARSGVPAQPPMPAPAARLPRVPQAGPHSSHAHATHSANAPQPAKPYYGAQGPLASRPGAASTANLPAGQAGYPASASSYATTGPATEMVSTDSRSFVAVTPGAGQLSAQHGSAVAATASAGTAAATVGAAAAATAAAAAAGSTGSSAPVLAAMPRKLSGRRRRETVAVLIFGGAPIFESSIPLSVFGVDRQDAGVPRYRLLVCAGEEGPLATTGGLTLTAPYGLEALSRAGTIVVPAWRSISQPPPVEAIAALRKAHHEGARIIGLCTGAFVLAAAGLLDGRPATTHWMYAPTLAKRYPRVHVDPRELFVDDGDVLTSAGTAAGIDLCLHVVRTDHGAEAANALARRLVVPSRRSGGGQAQYIDQSLPEEIGNDPLAEVVTWALENLNQQFDVEVLAARAYMSRRTFDRRFRTLTGSAPLQWLITQRVLQAQRLLETSELSVDDVARRCGFRSPVALRGHFRRQLGVSPAAYRTSYRARRPVPAATVPPQGHPGQGHPADRLAGMAGAAALLGTGSALGTAPGPTGTPGLGGIPGSLGAPGSGAGAAGAGFGGPTAAGPAGPSAVGSATGVPSVHQSPNAQASGSAASATAPPPGRGRLRPIIPPQPGAGAVRPSRPGERPLDRPVDRPAERTVEHAVAEDEVHGRPAARGLGQGHRADGTALPDAHATGAHPSGAHPAASRATTSRTTGGHTAAPHTAGGPTQADRQGERHGDPGKDHGADRVDDTGGGSTEAGSAARPPGADRQLSASRDRAVG